MDYLKNNPENPKEVELVLSAYRAIYSPFSYFSHAVTTGVRFYQVLKRHGVKSRQELNPDIVEKEIIRPNMEEAREKSGLLAAKTCFPIVVPGDFEEATANWPQEYSMQFWFAVIDEKVKEIYMMDGWEYSNGAVQEFTRGIENRVKSSSINVYNEKGNILSLEEGIEKLDEAIYELENNGFSIPILKECSGKLCDLRGKA